MILSNDSTKIEEMVTVMKDLLNSLFDAYSGWNFSAPLCSESFPSGSVNGGCGGSSSSLYLVDDMDQQQEYIIEHGQWRHHLRASRGFSKGTYWSFKITKRPVF